MYLIRDGVCKITGKWEQCDGRCKNCSVSKESEKQVSKKTNKKKD